MKHEYIYEDVKDFDLEHTFECGQCFRWNRQPDGSYDGIVRDRVVNIRVNNDDGRKDMILSPCSAEEFEQLWMPYLDLGRDYSIIKRQLSEKDPIMKKAIQTGNGIRILRQDLWETMVSFILSQNNNIPRIKGCIEKLCEEFGKLINTSGSTQPFYTIPTPEVLAQLEAEDLSVCRMGYRASYLIQTARQVLEMGGIKSLQEKLEKAENGTQVLEILQTFQGIGPKVANCIALFGAGRMDTFPIDVWVRRVMHELYGIDKKHTQEMEDFAKKHFGEWGGIAQQYLFYYIRERNRKEAEK